MQCSKLNDEEAVAKWWAERLAHQSAIHLADLSYTQQVCLTAWYALVLAEPPRPGDSEPMPVSLHRAVEELSQTSFSRPRRFTRQRVSNGTRRVVRRRKANQHQQFA